MAVYRKAGMFSFENEKRALATYYAFFRVQLENQGHSLSDLRKLHDALLAETKEPARTAEKATESKSRRIHILRATMSMLEMEYVHMRDALLRLGVMMSMRMEAQRVRIADS